MQLSNTKKSALQKGLQHWHRTH